jgi:predicted extracellular nuclease
MRAGAAAALVLGGCLQGNLTPIHDIQGRAHRSPLEGHTVSTRGVVTAVTGNGFYLEDPTPDGDRATSEAIFVFTGAGAPPGVAVGDDLTATGPVVEFRPGCASACAAGDSAFSNLTTTELDHPSLMVNAHDTPLPAPEALGFIGRFVPENVIEDDAAGDVETGGTFDPERDALDYFESLEAMRVLVADALVVGPTKRAAGTTQIPVLASGRAVGARRTGRGGVLLTADNANPERLILASGLGASLPMADVRDAFPGTIIGIIDYAFGGYQLLPVGALPTLVRGGLPHETLSLPPPGPGELRVSAFNVENLAPTDPPAKLARLAAIVVASLGAPDLISVEEIQDNDGSKKSGVVDASLTFKALTDAIRAAGGPPYDWRSIDPVDGQDGGEPGGNIRIGLLFRTDRGLAFVDRPGAGPLTPDAVVAAPRAALAYSPGRVDPTNPAFDNSRKPLAAELTFRGATLFVIANHFNARLGDQPLFGRFQPPAQGTAAQRLAQAQVVAGFVHQLLAADSQASVVVLGDLNDYEFSPPVAALQAAGLTALIETLPAGERYTYVFDGNSQALDHVLVSPRLAPRVTGYDIVHVNAEFATQASDHDPSVVSLSFD